MEIYQHDSAARFQFVLHGELSADQVGNLEHAWTTALSIVKNKELVLDVSGITDADEEGMELLCRMRAAGVHLIAAAPPQSEKLVRSLNIAPAAPRARRCATWVWRLLRLAGSH